MPLFNALIRGEALNSGCDIWLQEARNIFLSMLCLFCYLESFRTTVTDKH